MRAVNNGNYRFERAMSALQRLIVTVLPRSWTVGIEAESRTWMARCTCGFERSFWETGGVRWKGAGKERRYLLCPQCGHAHFHTIFRKEDEVPAKAA